MSDQDVGPAALLGVPFEYWLVRFDAEGACVSSQTRAALINRLKTIGKQPVILLSHGWNNQYSAAAQLYGDLLRNLAAHLQAHPLQTPAPLVVGVLWPSTWFATEPGPILAADFAAEDARRELLAPLGNDGDRRTLEALLTKDRLTDEEADTLAKLVAQSLAGCGEDAEGREAAAPDALSVRAAMTAVQSHQQLPATDDDTLPRGGTVDSGGSVALKTAGGLDAIRLASVYQMKDRAGIVGARGVGPLLAEIAACAAGNVICAGHSFGAKVVLSAIAQSGANVRGALLLEPAVSHLCFAEFLPDNRGRAGFANVPGLVTRAILSTYSANDYPLHAIFHLLLRRYDDLGELMAAAGQTPAGDPPSIYAALGGYGPRGVAYELRDGLPEPGTAVTVREGPFVIGFDGTTDGQIASHGDVATPRTAWLLRRLLEA